MLSFKELSERKTKVKINPKQSEITEKNGTCPKTGEAECKCDDKTPAQKSVAGKGKTCPECNGKGCKHCGGKGYMDGDSEGADMSEAKKKDDSYLEVNFKKRQANNEKARKEMDKVPSQKNPHFESTGDQAYGSQEEVSEESTEEVAETETLLTFKQFEEAEKRIKVKGSDKSKKIMPDAGPAYYKKPKDHVKYEEVELDENRRAARAAGGYKDDSKKQNDPSKAGFTGVGNMSIDQIRKMSARMDKEKTQMKKEEVVNEEGADSLKDRRMERGGVGGNQRYNKPVSNTPNTFGKKKPKYDGMSAVEKVKASIEKQYGKGAIIDTKKKK